ncbi:MAG: capsule biosynthesis protein [Pseudomonadota bacterium]
MTMKPKAKKFRIRNDGRPRSTPIPTDSETQRVPEAPTTTQANTVPVSPVATTIDDIRKEGLTGRQLRMARRVAQKNGLAVTSDFDAVRQLRAMGVDPFQRNTILELVKPEGTAPKPDGKAPIGQIQLPQTVQQGETLPSTELATPANQRAKEIMKIQRDMAKRRRRRMALLFARLSTFVLLPTAIVGYYFYVMATPMYATNSEFVIQQAEAASAPGGLGGLFQGTSLATQQDSIAVQSYLASRAAMLRLDADHGFKAHFSSDAIDEIQRLAPDATNEAAFKVYADRVKVSYDPTEGILRMEVIAADPETSQRYSEALIGYAEEQVDQLTQRPRDAAMEGALRTYEEAEQRRSEALEEWLRIQEELQVADPVGETAALTAQISTLEQQRQQLQLTLDARLSVANPNRAQVDDLRRQITSIEGLIDAVRSQISSASNGSSSLAAQNTRLRLAEENYTFQTLQVQAALAQREAAQIEANRQVRYLSLGVEPVAPDEATYPRAFESTILAFLIFSGIYLMFSLTASILREQVSS